MKELIKVKGERATKNYYAILAAAGHMGMAALGFVASRAVVLGALMPFGLSFLAGSPIIFAPSAAIGVFAGYFIPAVGDGGFRYVAAMLAILAIKLLLSGYKKISESPLFCSLICTLASVITAAVSLSGEIENVFLFLAESLLALGGAFFVCRTSRCLSHSSAGLSGDELASVLIVISVMLMGVSDIGIYDVSLGRILGVFLIFASAKYGGTLAGAASGIAVSLCAALTGRASGYSLYPLGGMMAGIFAPLGKGAEILSLFAVGIIDISLNGFGESFAPLTVELILGAALFLMLPKGAGIHLGKLFSYHPKVTVSGGMKKALMMRLTMASGALSDVSETVEQVARELGRINSPSFSDVISGVEKEGCAGCKLRIHCWEARREDTVSAVLEMTKAVKSGEPNIESAAPEEFKGRCMRPQSIGEAVKKNYTEYTLRMSAENRIDEVRSVVADQFEGISNMLIDLAADFGNDGRFDNAAALRAATALKNLDIRAEECSCRIDKFGRMTVEFKIKKESDTILNKLQIMKTLSVVCERDFDIPNISEVGNNVFITVSEHAALKVDIGVNQICASRSNMCGDAYDYFYDGKGHFVAVLSDGMGTGGRAAVDGAMASGLMARLLKAGFGYDCSLRILNSSMLFKSTDESLATVDIASIDLFTGQTELYKAGAAPTVVRRSGRTGKAVSTSLPVGILHEIGFDRAAVKLRAGDILLLLSDGAITEGTDWIRAELEAWHDGSAEDLAEHIAEYARRRRTDNHEDDITVMALIIERAV